VNEPIATMLVEVNWARGHLVREYTVLLDPPVFSGEAPNAAAATIAAPVTADSAHSGSVQRRAPSNAAAITGPTISSPASSSPASSSSGSVAANSPSSAAPMASGGSGGAARGAASAGGRYTVRSGDTLSSITSQAYGAGDRIAHQRELVAVYRANTPAFDGNMNILRAGSHLSLPGDAEVTAISPGEASAEVHKQYSAWNSGHAAAAAASGGAAGAGQLRLVPPQEAAQTPANTAAAAANGNAAPGAGSSAAAAAAAAGLQQRVTQLESQLAESQRLLQLKNSELAALQARSTPSAAAPAPSAPATPAAPAAAPSTAPPAPAPAPAASAPTPAETPPASPPPAPVAKPTVAPTPVASQSGNSFLDLLKKYWYLPAGLVAVLILLLIVRAVRARQEDAFDRSLGRLSQPGFDSKPMVEQARTHDTVPLRALAPTREEQSYRVEESGTHEQPASLAAKGDTSASGRHVAIDDSVSSEAPVALDQGDPLAEADFHMAYGLYDQAADLVQIAISREPERRDLRLKLLEVFFVWGNKDRFLASARELAATRDKALPGEWEKIVIMGRQIAPEDGLFASSGALPGAASGGVDLNLEGGQNRIDFDLMGEPTVSAPSSAGAIDLDLSKALGDSDATGESRPSGESGVDFVFDDAERGNEQTGSTREMPARGGGAGTTVTVQVPGGPGADPDAPTVEQPQLPGGDHPTIRQKIDAATRSGMVSSEQTAELELHDLGLDLGPMDTVGDDSDLTSGADAPTMVAGLDEETRQLLTRTDTERDGQDGKAPAAAGEPTDSGTWLFTDTDFADVVARSPGAEKLGHDAPTEVVTQLSQRPELLPEGDTARLAALETDGLDLDLGDLNKADSGHNGVDLDVGNPSSSSEGTFVQTQRIMAEDIPLPDLEPATMSEVGTKLDLARAYMDMGDPEGARSILSEVLSEGSVSQKQEARRLIDTLPG
ncbi:MAG TPA: FimV/HubP family polar landmark protein, partial [Steroidobacteraceae bacterium]